MKTQKFGMKNTYTIYKFVDGKKQVLAHFHNLVTARMKQQLTADSGVRIHSIWFGDGSAEPSESDTALTHPLWTFSWNYGNIISTERPELSQDGTWNILCTAKIDASDAYVGTVSEIGLYITVSSSGLAMGTHALIKDAEGNPMTITKTDTEVLYVDIHLQYQLSSSSEFEWSPWYYYLLGNKTAAQSWPQIPVLSSMQIVMLRAYPDLMSNGNIIGNRVLLTNSYDASRHVLTCSNGRFGTENQPTQEYVNAVGIIPGFWGRPSYDYYRPSVPMGFWKFPNPDIFPNTTLSDMRVGTGDGVKVDFTPPLNLWVKDTERVFVDGVLQVRDVDYTCDHRNNLSELYSLNPSIFCDLKNELVRQDSTATSGMGFHPLKGGCNDVASGSNNERRIYIVWDKDHPLEWELEPDPQIGIEADYFQMNAIQNTGGNYWRYAIFTLSYSEDGETWTDVESFTVTSSSNAAVSYRFVFPETITAAHWRLSTDVSGCSDAVRNGRFFSEGTSYLHRNGAPIHFTHAPADGAIITMTANIDRPMKNENFVLDVNPSFSL